MKKNKFDLFIEQHESFLVCSHETPDADALGSSIALAIYLNKCGKKVNYLLSEEIAISLEFLIKDELAVSYEELNREDYEAIIVLDSSNKRRTPIKEEEKIWKLPTCNIDHHPDNENFGDLNIVEIEFSSTGEILYDLFDKQMIDDSIAKMLFAAIVGDTGGFKHSNTSAKVMKIGSHLMQYQFDSFKVKNQLLDFRTKKAFSLVIKALSNVIMYDKFVIMAVDREIIKKHDLASTEYPDLINYIRGIEGTYVAIVFTEVYDKNIKISFRSVPPVDIAVVAREFGGGGHKYAAGCQLKGELADVVETVSSFTKNYLEKLEL